MQLTYTADWVQTTRTRRTLEIGIYLAEVTHNREPFMWDVDSDRGDRPAFAGGCETSWELACAAAEAAIREHHAAQ
jgi:hypothetical protein